jgi:hypothetical protein
MKIVLAIVAAVLACLLWVGRYKYETIGNRVIRVNVLTGRACLLWPPAPKVNPYAASLNSPPKPDLFDLAEAAFGDEAKRSVGACE